jgi:RNA-binding protein YhbY
MTLTSKQRRELLAASHALKPVATVPVDELSEALVEHVRAAFASQPLLKIRVAADNSEQTDRVAVELAGRVPCEVVKRVGRVVVLHRRPTEDGATDHQDEA